MEEKAIIEKIRRIRQLKQITLKELSRKTGLTEGYLSRIENSQTAPPISTLGRIAQGLSVDISYLLLAKERTDQQNPAIVVVRKDELGKGARTGTPHKIPVSGYEFEPLASEKHGKNMQPYILVPDFEPGDFLQHDGEEFFCVLEGQIEFVYGTEKYLMSAGDSAYFDSHIPHTGRSLGDEKARVLIILHPYKRF